MASIDFAALTLAPCVAAFGDQVVYTPGAGAPQSFLGIFAEYATTEQLDVSTGMTSEKKHPLLTFNVNDLPAGVPLPCASEMIQVNGRTWKIDDVNRDSGGKVALSLKIT